MDLTDIQVSLARLEGKVDGIKTRLDTLQDHEDRVRSLEKSSWKAQGWAACVAFLVAIVTTLFVHKP